MGSSQSSIPPTKIGYRDCSKHFIRCITFQLVYVHASFDVNYGVRSLGTSRLELSSVLYKLCLKYYLRDESELLFPLMLHSSSIHFFALAA